MNLRRWLKIQEDKNSKEDLRREELWKRNQEKKKN